MPQIIDIPGVGQVEFPDGMDDAAIEDAIKTKILPNYAQQQQQPGGREPTPERTSENPLVQAGSAFGRGATNALTSVLDLPGTLMDIPLRAVGAIGRDENLFAGAGKTARRALDAAAKPLLSEGQKMSYESILEVPRDYRWAAAAGEAAGSALPVGGAIGAASRGVNLSRPVGTAGPGLVEFAARNPRAALAADAAATAGAMQGGALASGLFPDSEIAPVVGQLLGSVAAPSTVIGKASGPVADKLNDVRGLFTQRGREARAAKRLGELLDEGGESADDLLRRLNTPDDVPGVQGVAERARSPTLLGMEARLAADNPDFARQVAARREVTDDVLQNTFRATAEPGETAPLTRAAESIRQSIDDFVSQAEQQASEAANRFARDPEARGMASVQAREVLDRAYEQSRTVERNLWGQLDLSQRVPPTNFLRAAQEIKSRMLPGETLPGPVQNLVTRLQGGRSTRVTRVQAQVLQNARSRLMELSRSAASGASPDRNFAAIYSRLADGLLDDLAPVAGSDEARAFSRALNDRWSRTFAGQTQATTSTGADRIAESLTLERAMQGTGPDRTLRLQQLRQAVSPLEGRTADLTPEMRAAQETWVRDQIAGLRDPATGRLPARAAERFLAQNDEVMQLFPGLRSELQQAVSADTAATAAAERAKALMDRQTALGRVLGAGERPDRAVSQVLTGNNPARDYADLANIARQGGEPALAGLRSATVDHLMTAARDAQRKNLPGAKEGFWHALHGVLNNPVTEGGPAMLRIMRDGGVMNATQAARLQQIVDRGVRIEQSLVSGRHVAQVGPASDMLTDTLIRLAGANYGSTLAWPSHVGGGSSLVAAGYGSRMFRHYLAQVPSQKIADVLQLALEDEAKMKLLLQKVGKSDAAQRRMLTRFDRAFSSAFGGSLLNATALGGAGVNAVTNE